MAPAFLIPNTMEKNHFCVPGSLLAKRYGGVTVPEAYRKTNFLKASGPFLSSLAADLGIHAQVEVSEGSKRDSGTARAAAANISLELSEPSTRDGLRITYTVIHDAEDAHAVEVHSEPLAQIADRPALNDFIWRVKKMLTEPRAPGRVSKQGGDTASTRPAMESLFDN